jgi:hypothetical protein
MISNVLAITTSINLWTIKNLSVLLSFVITKRGNYWQNIQNICSQKQKLLYFVTRIK